MCSHAQTFSSYLNIHTPSRRYMAKSGVMSVYALNFSPETRSEHMAGLIE